MERALCSWVEDSVLMCQLSPNKFVESMQFQSKCQLFLRRKKKFYCKIQRKARDLYQPKQSQTQENKIGRLTNKIVPTTYYKASLIKREWYFCRIEKQINGTEQTQNRTYTKIRSVDCHQRHQEYSRGKSIFLK